MKKIFLLIAFAAIVFSCGEKQESPSQKIKRERKEKATLIDNGLGVGEITTVSLNNPLN